MKSSGETVFVGLSEKAEQKTFPLYSVTKTLIAKLILDATQTGTITLNDTIGESLPEIEEEWIKRLKIADLLTHRSGLSDYGHLSSYQTAVATGPSSPYDIEKLVTMVIEQGPKFAAGSGFHYSNIGYYFLKRLVEVVHGRPFNQVIHKEFSERLCLHNTYVAQSQNDFRSLSFESSPSQFLHGKDARSCYHPGWVAHGLVITTARDILLIFNELFSSNSLAKSTPELLIKPLKLDLQGDHFQPHYGYGVIGDPCATFGRYLGHDGGGPGYSVSVFNVLNEYGNWNYCLVLGKEGFSGKDELAKILVNCRRHTAY